MYRLVLPGMLRVRAKPIRQRMQMRVPLNRLGDEIRRGAVSLGRVNLRDFGVAYQKIAGSWD